MRSGPSKLTTIKLSEADVQNCSWTFLDESDGYRRWLGKGTHPVTGVPIEVIKTEALIDQAVQDLNTEERNARLGIVDYVPSGSSLKFCKIAEGEADVYPRHGRTMEWDTAAGQAILEAAGGRVMALDGEVEAGPLRYRKADRGFDNPHFIAWGAQ